MDIEFRFPLSAGLHARPAAMLQAVVSRSRAAVTFCNHTRHTTADARSTIALIATLTRAEDACTMRVEGDDAAQARQTLEKWVKFELPHCDDGLAVQSTQPPPTGVIPRPLRESKALVGIAAGHGIAEARIYKARQAAKSDAMLSTTTGTEEEEILKFSRAVDAVTGELEDILAGTRGKAATSILRMHLSLVRDREFSAHVHSAIAGLKCSAGKAVLETVKYFEQVLHGSGSLLLEERIEDIHDIADRLLREMYGQGDPAAINPPLSDYILVVGGLTPSLYLALNREHLKGIILVRAEVTSHAMIMARTDGVPCVSGLADAMSLLKDGDEVILDGFRGLVFPNTSAETKRFFQLERRFHSKKEVALQEYRSLPGETQDGRRFEVAANAASIGEVEAAMRHGAEGIGVYRTEILFLEREVVPTEEELTDTYRAVVAAAQGKPVIFRTLDVGADKSPRCIPLPSEDNPNLGYRAVRIYQEFSSLIEAQVRAILQASASGPVRLMFPMISAVDEVIALRALVERCKKKLASNARSYDNALQIGIMVEVPGVVFQMDQFCPLVDFFSIGSNDLTQYLLAVDRGSDRVRNLYRPFHPGVLRSLKMIVDEAHRRNRWVGICGEMAGMDIALPFLVGIGVDELSVVPPRVSPIKAALRGLSAQACSEVAASALGARTADDAERSLQRAFLESKHLSLCDAQLVSLECDAESKSEAIREMACALESEGRIDDVDKVDEAIWVREDSFPTNLGFGIAIPHCKSQHVLAPSIAFIRLKRPVAWQESEEPVSLIVLLAIPERDSADTHLKIIARLARRLMSEEYRQELFGAVTAEHVVALLSREIVS